MKKRKELDALLTMANGKKNGKSKRSKEGHELLRLDSDSISSDNDELFLAPKKTVVRRPKSCQCCTMCVPLVMFILTMGCMVITGGLIWMHFNLKQDLDNLRRSLEKVEIKADSATSQQATILSLESGLDKFNGIPEKVDTADIKIRKLNQSLSDIQTRQGELDTLNARIEALEGKASSTSVADLQQNVADLGSEIEDLKTKNGVQEDKISGFEVKITDLTNEINTLKGQVALLQNPPTTPPTEEVVPPATPSATTTRHPHPATNPATSSGSSGPSSPQLIEIKEDITRIWTAIHEVQSTATNLSREHNEVVASLTRLRQTLMNGTADPHPAVPTTTAGHSGISPQSIQARQFDLAQMKADIELLKEEYNRSIVSMPITDMPVVGESTNFNATWMQSLTDRISRIEESVDQLNSGDGNSHLINVNQTDSIQMLLERSLSEFKEDNFADVTGLQSDVATIQTDITALQTDVNKLQLDVESAETFDNEVGTRIAGLQDQISTLKQDCSSCSSAGTSSTISEGGSVPIQDPSLSELPTESPSSSSNTTAPERTADGTSL